MRERKHGKRINAFIVATSVNDHLYGRISYDIFSPHHWHWLLSITAQNLP